MNTHKLSPQNCENLSALADGELAQGEFQLLLQICEQDPRAYDCWDTYHALGELLRSPSSKVQLSDPVFLARLNQQLAKEPSFETRSLIPASDGGVGDTNLPRKVVGEHRESASNDAYFGWKAVAGFACIAVTSAIAWNINGLTLPAFRSLSVRPDTVAEAAAPQQVVVASPQGFMVRDTRLEELLAAHKQLGVTSALPVPSGFLRNATFETQQQFGH